MHADEWKYHRAYRQFCTRHLKRGDSDREDCDENYEPDGDIGPALYGFWRVSGSPSWDELRDEERAFYREQARRKLENVDVDKALAVITERLRAEEERLRDVALTKEGPDAAE